MEALLAGGFDIKNRKFTATADNFKVQNNRGEWTFLVDENGKLNAKLIDATEIFGLKIAQPFTDSKTYRMYWKLSDYLDVLTVLAGHRFIYFTSNKSSVIELCDWIGNHPNLGNPFRNCHRKEFNAHMNYSSSYTDIMLYTDVA